MKLRLYRSSLGVPTFRHLAGRRPRLGAREDDIEDLEAALDRIQDKLEDAKSAVEETIDIADGIGGEISRVVGGQLRRYTAPVLQDFIEKEQQPGSVDGLKRFLETME